jgi:outer membrane receptor protein involved in Fe transport
MRNPVFGVVAYLLAVPAIAGGQSAPVQLPAETPGESVVEDVVVVTASRREEQLLNAPATVSVIGQERVDNAPVQNVPDLLRAVPGLNTVQSSARDFNVTSRAATGTLANSMLVLLDGRSIYQDFFGFVTWDFLPIDTGEIKQIEVIRGPASAVWGANAMTGVINIISKTPREMAGTSVSIRFGQFDRTRDGAPFDGGGLMSASARHARATSDRLAYKVSVGVMTQEPFLRPTGFVPGTQTPYPPFTNSGTSQVKLDARVDYDLAEPGRKLVVAGGSAATEGIIHTGLGPLHVQPGSSFSYGRVTYTRGRAKLQAFVNALNGRAPSLLQRDLSGKPMDFDFVNQAYDVELSNFHLLRSRHLLSYGGNVRHNDFRLSFARRGDNRNEAGAYAQDEIILSNHYRWIVGARVDRVDVLKKAVVSPRTTFLIKPRESQTIRLSFNRAFRAPSFTNSYFDIAFLNQVDLGAAGLFRFPSLAVGNEGLHEEGLTAVEAGYIGGFGKTTLSAAFYVYRTKNMIQFTSAASYGSSNPPPGWPLPAASLDRLAAERQGLTSQFTYKNFDRIVDRGLELGAEVNLLASTSAFANYTWQADPDPTGFDISELNLPPTHRFNIGVSAAPGRVFGSVSASFVDSAFWQDVLPGYEGPTRAYALADGEFGVHSRDGDMTVAVRVNNMLNRHVQQHVFGDVIGRTVTGEVRFQF